MIILIEIIKYYINQYLVEVETDSYSKEEVSNIESYFCPAVEERNYLTR